MCRPITQTPLTAETVQCSPQRPASPLPSALSMATQRTETMVSDCSSSGLCKAEHVCVGVCVTVLLTRMRSSSAVAMVTCL